jgi:hypothetical protein
MKSKRIFQPGPAVALQRDMEDALRSRDASGIVDRLELDRGNDVTDLLLAVDVRVSERHAAQWRLFSIITSDFIKRVISRRQEAGGGHGLVYATGGPLIVVANICGATIVDGVLRYLELEAGRKGR